jgi:oxygen-independent coproporphyrinogen-3 oxidase
MPNPIGLYIHVPFCDGKCPYCDFFSLRGSEAAMDEYTDCIIDRIKSDSARVGRTADTLYFGGGTPSLLGGKRITRIVEAARSAFVLENAEITVEANPGGDLLDFFREVAAAGVNRISLGLQSANENELRLLGRRHTAKDAAKAVEAARSAGIANISLDLMLAVQEQTEESLAHSIRFCSNLGAEHVSAYLLQLEPHTLYWKEKEALRLPDEEETAERYLFACRELERLGYRQYEISNFARPGRESRHNLKYWRCEEYLGLGPSAHSFLDGKRFHFERSLRGFLNGGEPVQDGPGGDFEEFAMLRLRLAEGLTDEACRAWFGKRIPERVKKAALLYESGGLTACGESGFRLTPRGFLLSNLLTAELLFARGTK